MSHKESREGITSILRVSREDELDGIVVLPAHPEDLSKKKKERQSGDEWLVLDQSDHKINSTISGGVKRELHLSSKESLHRVNLQREAKAEFGLDLTNDQIGGEFAKVGVVDQLRNDREVQFMVWMFGGVLLQNRQIEELERWFSLNTDGGKKNELEIIQANQADVSNFLEVNKNNIRPSFRMALTKAFSLQREIISLE